jgi:hypothetical protein
MAIGKTRMVEAEQVENRGLKIVECTYRGDEGHLVGRQLPGALDSAARSHMLYAIGWWSRPALSVECDSDVAFCQLTAPDSQSVVEQASPAGSLRRAAVPVGFGVLFELPVELDMVVPAGVHQGESPRSTKRRASGWYRTTSRFVVDPHISRVSRDSGEVHQLRPGSLRTIQFVSNRDISRHRRLRRGVLVQITEGVQRRSRESAVTGFEDRESDRRGAAASLVGGRGSRWRNSCAAAGAHAGETYEANGFDCGP